VKKGAVLNQPGLRREYSFAHSTAQHATRYQWGTVVEISEQNMLIVVFHARLFSSNGGVDFQ